MSDFLLGCISGIGQVIVGYPFDTVKVRIQNNATIKNMNFSHYYRGMTYPLISSSIINAIVFGTYYNSLDYTNNRFLSGMLSGTCCTPVLYFFDVFKTKRQMNEKVSLKSITQSKGLTTTLLRENIAFGIYFSSYDYLRDQNYNAFLSGGIAGILNWTATYNLDVVRNRQIAANISFVDAFKQGNLWKGYSVCIIRAFIANSVGFTIFDEGKKLLNDNED